MTELRRQNKRSKVRAALGQQNVLVDAHDAILKLRALRTAGLSTTYIAEQVGYEASTLRQLVGRKGTRAAPAAGRRITRSRAEATDRLYAQVMHERQHHDKSTLSDTGAMYGRLVPIRLTRLALEGLQAQGWSQRWIADRLGGQQSRVYRMLHVARFVTPEMEAAVLEIVREIGSAESTEPRALRTKNEAARRGYAPTMYTDELV